jgi:hypothetical protein
MTVQKRDLSNPSQQGARAALREHDDRGRSDGPRGVDDTPGSTSTPDEETDTAQGAGGDDDAAAGLAAAAGRLPAVSRRPAGGRNSAAAFKLLRLGGPGAAGTGKAAARADSDSLEPGEASGSAPGPVAGGDLLGRAVTRTLRVRGPAVTARRWVGLSAGAAWASAGHGMAGMQRRDANAARSAVRAA